MQVKSLMRDARFIIVFYASFLSNVYLIDAGKEFDAICAFYVLYLIYFTISIANNMFK